ncbi:MAG: esterase [Ferrovum sp.]|nr:esterase [Ferrovum sp.]NDU88176.1 esterase [Ferrovum sp.]
MKFLSRVGILLSVPLLLSCQNQSSTLQPALPVTTTENINLNPLSPQHAPSSGFTSLVAFGDSLSDMGSYTLVAQQSYGLGTRFDVRFTGLPYQAGGQFTVNGSTSGNWVGDLASSLHLTISPHLVGYGNSLGRMYLTPTGGTLPSPNPCAFGSPLLNSHLPDCLDFAQGGAMIQNPNGVDHEKGALTLPISQQVSQYLHEFHSFHGSQLITIFAGNNDVLRIFGDFLTALTVDVQQTVATENHRYPDIGPIRQQEIAMHALIKVYPQALAHAEQQIDDSADNLSHIIHTVHQYGGEYILVYTLPDAATTPFGRGLPYTLPNSPQPTPLGYVCDLSATGSTCRVLSLMIQRFNQRLLYDLRNEPVKIIDDHELFAQVISQPAAYGFTNVISPWCAPTLHSSLLCNENTPNTTAGADLENLHTWLFADLLHPTPAGYQVLSDNTYAALKSFGWLKP